MKPIVPQANRLSDSTELVEVSSKSSSLHGSLRLSRYMPAGIRRYENGFSLIELLFAIAIMGIGIIAILSVFLTGLASASWAGNATVGSIEAQTLLTKITSETDAGGNHVYLDRIETAASVKFPENEWIHSAGNQTDPVLIDPDPSFSGDQSKAKTDLWWQCRVSQFPMDEKEPLDASKDDKSFGPYPRGLYQIAIAVYRNVKPGAKKKPLSVYTTLITVQP